MKRYKINKQTLIGCLIACMTMSSCDDFLTIYPTSQIVEEDFWEDRNDLENVVASCYTRLTGSDIMSKFIIWGEMRGDNFTQKSGNNNTNIENLMNANLLPTNDMFSWTCFYNEINYCNKVLVHGPEIVEKDQSFSDGDWQPIRAEMMTLRALSHFYLVRAFGEIPYVTEDYNNDSQYFPLRQSTQQEVLDSIIMDLEEVKDYAMEDYGKTVYNKGRITRKAVYTLLADVYLWRASKNASADSIAKYGNQYLSDYQKCIECCDYVIESMLSEQEETLVKGGYVLGGLSRDLTIQDLLIPNEYSSSTNTFALTVGAYDELFGDGNSSESIFELQFDGTNNANTLVTTYYQNIKDSKTGELVLSDALYGSVTEGPNALYPAETFPETDYRRWETTRYVSATQSEYPCGKYVFSTMTQGTLNTLKDNSTYNDNTMMQQDRSLPCDANWIIYRLSDVLLMKAEAMSQIYSDEENLTKAFSLVAAIFERSNPYAYTTSNTSAGTDSLVMGDFISSQESMEALVMAERQREFVGEGKRWFDLVRYAQRKGSTEEMFDHFLSRKYGDNVKSVRSKLATMQSLFNPVYESELDNNPLLHQNSIWETTKSTSKTDDL